MVIQKNEVTLLNQDAEGIFGVSYPIDSDYSLHALLRAIVLKNGFFKPEDLLIKANARVEKIKTRQELTYVMQDHLNSAFRIIEYGGNMDQLEDDCVGWKTTFFLNGKPFPVNQYLSQFARTKIYQDEVARQLVIVVSKRANNIWLQALESVLCRLMPWYFPTDLPEDEQRFYRTIAVDNKEITLEEKTKVFINYVNEAAKGHDFRGLLLHKRLDGIADKQRQAKITSLKKDAATTTSTITRLTNDLAQYYQALDSILVSLNALENTKPETDDSMFKFFNSHKQVHLINVLDNQLEFGVDDTLEFYDEDELIRMLENKSSYLYNYSEETRNGLKALFVDHKGILRVNAVFVLGQFKLVRPRQCTSFIQDSMPNPHIFHYGCSGGNDQYYSRYAESGDWDLGIEQAISATKNLAWGDSAVCSKMIEWLVTKNTPCIYVSEKLQPIDKVANDMKLVSFKDFLNMIKITEGREVNG